MEASQLRNNRGRGAPFGDPSAIRRPNPRNKQWTADQATKGHSALSAQDNDERWVRGGGVRGGRGRIGNLSMHRVSRSSSPRTTLNVPSSHADKQEPEDVQVDETHPVDDPDPDGPEDREKFYQDLVKAREIERKKAIAEGKMDDPLVAKRLEDAITLVGTCMDMCPRFERYRRERENNLFEWETVPGTKRVDHRRAVKMYERAAGDKTLPSDLRPPIVLKRTLDYLFHDLIPTAGFSQTFNFIRDRTRSVRNDFTMQHETGRLAMECHDRCARFHILALHFERDREGFSIALEEQQLMNTLQSLKEFYEDQRGRYMSPTELEMRVYHRLIHIRDQKERHEDVPAYITDHPVFKLTTKFRLQVQTKSAPIGKTSLLVVDAEAMKIFGELAVMLRQQGNIVMIYLVACLLERLFGKETIDEIESIRGDLTIPELIDGAPHIKPFDGSVDEGDEIVDEIDAENSPAPALIPLESNATELPETNIIPKPSIFQPLPHAPLSAFQPLANPPTSAPAQPPASAFSTLSSSPNPFGANATFGGRSFGVSTPPKSVFDDTTIIPHTTPQPSAAPVSTSNPITSTFNSSPFTIFTSATSGQQTIVPPSSDSSTHSQSPLFGLSTKAPSLPPSNLNNPPSISATANLFSGTSSQPFPTLPISTPSALNPAASRFIPSFAPSSKPQSSTESVEHALFPSTTVPSTSETQKLHPTITSAFSSTPSFTAFNPPATRESAQSAVDVATQDSSQVPQNESNTFTFPSHPPPLHKINTSIDASTTIPQPPSAIPSPAHPPPLSKQQPISLPPTPTSPVKPPSAKSWLDSLRGQTSVSTSQELLSPLYLSSPSGSPAPDSTASGPVSASPADAKDTSSSDSIPIKRKDPILFKSKGKQAVLHPDTIAVNFSQKSCLVKECFRHWRKRFDERAAWIKACEHSDAYRQKVQLQRMAEPPVLDRKRISSVALLETPQKRARRRVSSIYQPPRTDEELAQRLKENQKEHEHRWVKGSFLQALRSYIKSKYGSSPPGWAVWLSANPENDGTAIWLEHKFDAPASGQWVSENVFSMPLQQEDANFSPSPGVIVFECTPLERVSEEIQRKYCILDDCARLGDIVGSLPPKRPFIPSLLVFCWAQGGRNELPPELLLQITKLVEESVLGSYHLFFISSAIQDFDRQFDEAMKSLTFDVEGKRVQSLTLRGVFRLFEKSWVSFYSEWIENCSSSGEFNWILYGRLMETSVKVLNYMTQSVLQLIGTGATIAPLPDIDPYEIADSRSAYARMILWLADRGLSEDGAAIVSRDLLLYQDMGKEFPSPTFLDRLRDLAESRTQSLVGDDTKYNLLKSDITLALEQFQLTLESLTVKLRQVHVLMYRSPKRRYGSEGNLPPISSAPKRMKSASSAEASIPDPDGNSTSSHNTNGRGSPSPSSSTISGPPPVTVGMLRNLTKDIKRRYGVNRS